MMENPEKESNMEIAAFACDIDNTLTDDAMLLDLYAVDAIRLLEAIGLPVILVTARDYMTAGSLSAFIGTCGIVAAEDGAVVGAFQAGQPPLVLGNLARIESGLAVLRETLGDELIVYPVPGRMCSAVIRRTFDLNKGNATLEESGAGAHLLDSGLAYLLVDAETSKGRGLREAAKLLDIEPENIVAIGDNFNDLDMFAAAGYSIAVGNAPEAVKEQVSYACSARFGAGFCEGVKHALRRFPLPGIHRPRLPWARDVRRMMDYRGDREG
jgi:phosphoglycolate phosphatase (TIGR01487 family)